MVEIKNDAQFLKTGRDSAPANLGSEAIASKRQRAEVEATRAAQMPSEEDRREGLTPDELNATNDK